VSTAAILQYRRDKGSRLTEKARERLKDALADQRCLSWYHPKNRYEMAVRFAIDEIEAKVQFGAKVMKHMKGGIRVELNPYQWTPARYEALHGFICSVVGTSYDDLLVRSSSTAWIWREDLNAEAYAYLKTGGLIPAQAFGAG